MMHRKAEDAARRAASRLAEPLGESVAALVERVLALGGAEDEESRYEPVTALAVAGLIVSAASLAWTVYRDLRSDRRSVEPTVIARRLRVEIGEVRGVTMATRDRVIAVVVDEIVQSE